ncbi:hypothetical protein J3R30DRAFT_3655635 [Lentinula aciculospora]|uniref:FAD-binding domain-containing protein n=1 Tax=Lentinula aciculospora TaxID=153920 RepID=A0A9W9ALC5_9AGAR|nr:hypothetical protein J3R30DRAFT_3655635 [Lentinula aciculospora]
MSNSHKFKVGICGGGIGGLCAALALSRYDDIDVDVYESTNSFAEVGVGIGIWPRAWEILKELGLKDALLQVALEQPSNLEVPTFNYRKSNHAFGIDITTMYAKLGGLKPFYRPDFQNVLLRHLPTRINLHVNKRLISYSISDSGCVEMQFSDGSSTICDLLVGADGIKSAVRRTLLMREAQQCGDEPRAIDIRSGIDAVWSGIIAYRTVIPTDMLSRRYPNHPILTQPTHYLGRDSHIIAYPISQGRLVNFAAFNARYDLENPKYQGSWTSTTSKDELKHLFVGWEPDVLALIDCAGDPLKWAIHTVKPLHSFVSGSEPVALLGDASHACEPHNAHVSQDAYILAAVLENLLHMLSLYDEIRRPCATDVARKSHEAGRAFALHGEDPDFDASRLLDLQQLLERVRQRWEYVWDSTLKIDEYLKLAP